MIVFKNTYFTVFGEHNLIDVEEAVKKHFYVKLVYVKLVS